MNKRSVSALIRAIDRKKIALGKLRDDLRKMESDLSGLGEDASEALENLTNATDALSRLV